MVHHHKITAATWPDDAIVACPDCGEPLNVHPKDRKWYATSCFLCHGKGKLHVEDLIASLTANHRAGELRELLTEAGWCLDHRTPLDDDQACMACEAEAREARHAA